MAIKSKIPIALSVLITTSCGESSTITPAADLKEPRCEKKMERLSIDTYAEKFGLTKPCDSQLQLYTIGIRSVRSVSSTVSLSSENRLIAEYDWKIEFINPDKNFLKGVFNIPIQEDYSCKELDAKIGDLVCVDNSDEVVTCPEVRLKAATALRDLTINKAPNICYDD